MALRQIRGLLSGSGMRAQLLRGGLGSLIISVGQAGLGFTLALILARLLGPEGYGIYSFAFAVLMLAAIPAQVGVPLLMVRETAKAHATENWALMRGLWRWGNIAVSIFSVVGVLFVVGALLALGSDSETGRTTTVAIGVVLIPLIALANVRGACLRGLHLVVISQLPENIIRPALLIILIFLSLLTPWASNKLTPELTMTLHVIAAMLSFVIGAVMLMCARPLELKLRPNPSYETVAWRKAVIPLAMISSLHLINNYADILILGIFRPDDEVGVYRAVFQIAMLVVFGLQAVNRVLHPHFARLYKNEDMQSLQRLVTVSARVILALALPSALVCIVFGSEVLELLFGKPFAVGGLALAILAGGQLINAALGSVGALLNMTGHERDTVFGLAIAMLVNVILDFILIPLYGINGAATATTLSLLVWNYLLRNAVWKRLAIESSAIGRKA